EAETDECQARDERPHAVARLDEPDQDADPGERDDEAGDDERALCEPLREARRRERREKDPQRGGREDDAGLDRAVAADLLQEDRDDKRHAHEHQPLDVLRDEREVAHAALEELGMEQHFFPRSLASADEEEERGEEKRTDDEEDREERVVRSRLEDPE